MTDVTFTPPTPTLLKGVRGAKPTVIGSLRLLRQLSRNPLAIWSDYHFEDPIIEQTWIGGHSIILNDPDAIRHCFIENADNYRHEDVRQRVLKPFLREGLLTAEGRHWRRSRRIMSPVFTPRHVNSFANTMLDVSDRFAEGMRSRIHRPVDISSEMVHMTYDILIETLFSGQSVVDGEELTDSIAHVLETSGRVHPFDVLGAPDWMPRPGRLSARRPINDLRSMIDQLIEARSRQIEADETVPDDFLTLLIKARSDDGSGAKLTQQDVNDNIVTFIGAGHETTARSLGWALYLLAEAPHYMKQLQAELDAAPLDETPPAEWLELLPFTRAVFEEAMRLYPPATNLLRQAKSPDTVGGRTVHKDTIIMVSLWLLHRHRLHWDRPDAFDPSRFLPENRERIDRLVYLPFGIGQRVCIGAKFAMQEGVIALASLLRRYSFQYIDDQPPSPVQKVTLQPETGMLMRVTPR